MNTCAKVKDGLVVNVIICRNVAWANEKLGGSWVAVPDGEPCGIGYEYRDGEFVAPEREEEDVDTDTD